MPPPNILSLDGPLAGVRGIKEYTIGTDDVVIDKPGYVIAQDAGDLFYFDTLDQAQSITLAANGIVRLNTSDIVIPVFVKTIRGTTSGTTVNKVWVGIL